jgi:hypothetical protein
VFLALAVLSLALESDWNSLYWLSFSKPKPLIMSLELGLTVHGSLENLKPISIPKERLFLLLTALNPTHWPSFLLRKEA